MRFAIVLDKEATDHARFLADLDLMLSDYGGRDVADIDIGQFLNEILALTRQCKVTLPSSITGVARGIVTLEGTIAPYIPNENIISIINAHIANSKNAADELADAMKDLARAIRLSGKGALDSMQFGGEALKMLTRGQIKMNMEMLGSDAPIAGLSKIVNRMALAMIVAGLFVGSSLLSLSAMEPRWLGVPILAFFGYLGAAVLSAWVIVSILRKK